MAKKSKSKSKKAAKRDNDLFAQLRDQGVRKSVADRIARASAGLDSGKKKAEQGVRDAAESFRKLAAELESKLPGDTDVVPKATPAKKPAARKPAARKPAASRSTAAKKPAARRTTKSTAASRSAAAKKAAATRKANAAKRAAGGGSPSA